MNSGLLSLLPRTIKYKDRNYKLLKDRHIFDTNTIATTDISADFFKTTSGKKKSQANFTGDLSLVKEANIFLVFQAQAEIRDRILTKAEWKPFFQKGYFIFNVIVPETITVDEDNLSALASGPDASITMDATAAAFTAATAWDRTYAGRRTYIVGENKVVPGGRAVEFTVSWSESGGNGLAAAADLRLIFGGGEYEPARS